MLADTTFDDPLVEHCVTARAATDANVNDLADDPERVSDLISSCSGHVVIAREFANNASTDMALSQAQVDCLAVGFAALPPEAVNSMVAAGLNPDLATDEQNTEASIVVGDLLSACTS